jgi:NAD(P)-dependent dehydrogenase (short-subunit alcohol dehydrogenase family)
MPVAIVTGGSKGLGRALSAELARRGWCVVIDARRGDALVEAAASIRAAASGETGVVAIAGDVSDSFHREALVAAAGELGGLDLLVNNASTLGPSPLLEVTALSDDDLRRIYEIDVIAPVALLRTALPLLDASTAPVVVNITSDASVEHYETWGGYGSAKAALDHLSVTIGKEHPKLRVLAIDPGDMRTEMHQAAFLGEDISDRPPPEAVVPAIIAMLTGDIASGRHRAAVFAPAAVSTDGSDGDR